MEKKIIITLAIIIIILGIIGIANHNNLTNPQGDNSTIFPDYTNNTTTILSNHNTSNVTNKYVLKRENNILVDDGEYPDFNNTTAFQNWYEKTYINSPIGHYDQQGNYHIPGDE